MNEGRGACWLYLNTIKIFMEDGTIKVKDGLLLWGGDKVYDIVSRKLMTEELYNEMQSKRV